MYVLHWDQTFKIVPYILSPIYFFAFFSALYKPPSTLGMIPFFGLALSLMEYLHLECF